MKVRESWGEGNPLAGAQGVPFPPSPPSFPNALFSGGWSGATTLPLSPRQPSPGNAKKRTSRSLTKKQQRVKQQKPAIPAGFLVCTAKQAAEKICRLRWHFCRTSGDRKAALPHSPLRRKQAHKTQEGNYKTSDLTPAGARQTCSCYGKRNRQHLTKAKPHNAPPRTPGTVDKRQTTAAPRRLILQMSAFWGRRGEFEGGGNPLLRAS